MKTAIKHENYEFSVIYFKHVTGLTGLANPTGTEKLWEITHKNGHKHENDEFLVMRSNIFRYYGHCKSPRNPNTVGNNS